MRTITDLAAPLGYFSAEHANKIAVQPNGIDYVKGEKQQTNASEIKDNVIDPKRNLTARGRWWLRKQVQNRKGKNRIEGKENSDSDKPRPEFAPTKIGVPCFFSRKTLSRRRLPRLPLLESDAEIPPAKWCQS